MMGFIIGLFIGNIFGWFIAALCVVSKEADRDNEQ